MIAEYSTDLAETQQVSYLTTDHLGSPRLITNEIGAVKKRQDFAAFGDETLTAARVSDLGYTTADELRQDYTGHQKDNESGLEYAQARYYNTPHGRFTSVDPLTASATIRNPQSVNRYSYVLNSPYKFTDPLGLAPATSGSFCAQWCNGTGPMLDGSNIRGRDATFDGLKTYNEQMAEWWAEVERGAAELEAKWAGQSQGSNCCSPPADPSKVAPSGEEGRGRQFIFFVKANRWNQRTDDAGTHTEWDFGFQLVDLNGDVVKEPYKYTFEGRTHESNPDGLNFLKTVSVSLDDAFAANLDANSAAVDGESYVAIQHVFSINVVIGDWGGTYKASFDVVKIKGVLPPTYENTPPDDFQRDFTVDFKPKPPSVNFRRGTLDPQNP